MRKKTLTLTNIGQKLKLVFILFPALIGCNQRGEHSKPLNSDGWVKETKVSKLIKNVNFVFPEAGYAFENKEALIKQTFDAIEDNKRILKKSEFNDTIYVRVMSSRDEMFIYTGTRAYGNAYPYWSTLNIVSNEDALNPPIKHEMMHLMAMLDWDYPKRNSTWINEGIATYSANNCNGYNVAQIYRFFMAEDKLIPIEDLVSNFYGNSEMVSYHQSGYIVQYLLENYTIDQFKQLWTGGFEKFENIYGLSYQEIENNLKKAVVEKYPEVPKIDWEVFSQGCK
tara:strand:+ start:876 stop:1721 length:846 start_codon:yes stop_codon:yes gene_type:complete